MPNRDWKFRIEDILEAIDDIALLSEGMSYEQLRADARTVKALLYDLAVIGEAASRIPQEIKVLYPHIPWREMGDMRNVVIHEYFGVDLQIIWETIHHDLPPLAPLLRTILARDSQSIPEPE